MQVIYGDVPVNSAVAWVRELSESFDVGMHIRLVGLARLIGLAHLVGLARLAHLVDLKSRPDEI